MKALRADGTSIDLGHKHIEIIGEAGDEPELILVVDVGAVFIGCYVCASSSNNVVQGNSAGLDVAIGAEQKKEQGVSEPLVDIYKGQCDDDCPCFKPSHHALEARLARAVEALRLFIEALEHRRPEDSNQSAPFAQAKLDRALLLAMVVLTEQEKEQG